MAVNGSRNESSSEARAKDLDETRRLLYMALVASRTKRYNLVGTLVNALKHHQKIDEDVDVMFDRLIPLVEGTGQADDRRWLLDQIERIGRDEV